MDRWIRVSDDLAVGGEPTPEDLAALEANGFQGVIDLRQAGEPGATPDEERRRVTELGMFYRHVPVPSGAIRDEHVDAVHRELVAMQKPVYVHCRGGGRAGALVAAHLGVIGGLDGAEALARARAAGLKWDSARYDETIEAYVDRRRAEAT